MGLTVCQQNGMFKIQFSKMHIAIMGPAGTGKTYLLRQVLEYLESSNIYRNNIAFCAPTHAAKKVLQDTINSGRAEFEWIKAHTIHSLLRIHPDTYEDEIVFDPTGEVPELENIKYIVCDEISMLDGILTSKLMDAASKNKLRIIGLGDPYQIQPVNPDGCYNHQTLGRISPIFFHKDFERVILEEIVRQSKGNPIVTVATKIRKEGSDIFECVGEDGKTGVFRVTNEDELVNEYLKYVKCPADMLNYKLMAYTNQKVDAMNDYVRQKLFNTSASYVESEYIVMQEPVYDYSGKFKRVVYNNGEICEIIEIEEGSEIAETFEVEGGLVHSKFVESEDPEEMGFYDHNYSEPPLELKVWKLKVRSVDEDTEFTLYSIKDDDSKTALNDYLSLVAQIYKEKGKDIDQTIKIKKSKFKMSTPEVRRQLNSEINELRNERREMWNEYWKMKGKFVNVKGAAACTFHKSQGATYTGVFISTDKMEYADYFLARQLKYVATTRAKQFVYFT